MVSSVLGVLKRVHPAPYNTLGKYSAILMVAFLALETPVGAQDNGELVASLVDRVGTLEEELRNLRGEIEEARHEIALLKKSFETLNTDVDFRLKESGGAPAPSPELPQEMPDVSSSLEGELGRLDTPSLPRLVDTDSVSTAEGEYERARAFLEKGDYEAAEKAFAAFLKDHATHDRASAASYWLGVTHFVRNQYDKAASVFAKVYKDFPKSPKAPDSLLKLAKSLGALDRKADACTALDQLSKEYPRILTDEVSTERNKYNCK